MPEPCLIPYYGLGAIVELDEVYNPSQVERVKSWRRGKLNAGLCSSCGHRPLALSKLTGKPINYCRVCADKFNAAKRKGPKAA